MLPRSRYRVAGGLLASLLTLAGAAPRAGAVLLSVPSYKQCNSPWSGDQLGTCSETMCSAGCAVTSSAMLYEYYGGTMDPGELNACLTSNGGYMSGCLLYWINSCMPAGVSYDGTSGSIDTALGAGHPVIAHVSNTSTSMHFVVIIGNNGGDYQINDPGWSYQTISAGNYTIEGLRFYSGTPVVCDCTPGDDEQRSCGFCGTETRVCDSSCAWGDWSCVDPGVCEPDNQEACGLCGTRSCDQACQWGACDDPCSVDAGPPDGGADSGSDAAQEEDASNDEDAGDNADAGDEHPGPGVVGGCSCRADDRDGATAPWTFILLGLLALSLRRRRRTK